MGAKKSTVIIVLAATVLLSLVFLFRLKGAMDDFEVNFKAGQRIRSGETLYRATDGHWQFKYPPFSAFLYVPLTLLPLVLAKAVWLGVVALAIFMIFFVSSKLIDFKDNTFFSPAFFAALILARYFLRELHLGQINALITFLLVLAIWLLAGSPKPGESAAIGAMIGLATALKPYALIFMPYLAVRKKWLALAAGLGVLSLTAFAPALFYGWDGNLVVLREWRSSLAASTPPLLSAQDNVSLLGFLMKHTHGQRLSMTLYGIILAGVGALVLFLLYRGNRVSRPIVLEGFFLLALIPLISPLGWDYTFLSAAPALMLICKHFGKFRPFWRAVFILNSLVIVLSLYDLMGRHLYSAFMSTSVITLDFLIILGYLAFLRIKGHA